MQPNFLTATGISASGMAAERTRMEVIANNIANAQSASPQTEARIVGNMLYFPKRSPNNRWKTPKI